jgi:hypothetical protein
VALAPRITLPLSTAGTCRVERAAAPEWNEANSMIARLLSVVRGGHRWETVEDPAGTFARCERCGTLDQRRSALRDAELPFGPVEDILLTRED